MTRPEFDQSLELPAPPPALDPPLAALWWISNNRWQEAHDLIDAEPGQDAAWVHAYLHRIEGDEFNTGYWYARAGRERPDTTLRQELGDLLDHFCD